MAPAVVVIAATLSRIDGHTYYVLPAILIVLVLSVAAFVVLVRRSTTQRQWIAMAEWARASGFRVYRRRGQMPPLSEPLAELRALEPRAQVMVADAQGKIVFVQMQTNTTPASRTPERMGRWNLLVRRLEGNWPATGLRPAVHQTSVLDMFGLASFPSLGNPERFVVFGSEAPAAAALAASPVRALLPPDVGVLVVGPYILLDFSTRPFDTIEFGRMLALAEQVLAHLPSVAAPAPVQLLEQK